MSLDEREGKMTRKAMTIEGPIVHAPYVDEPGRMEYIPHGRVTFDERTGRVTSFEKTPFGKKEIGEEEEEVVRLKPGQFLCPGFIDLHVHAPQYSFQGTGTDLPLMEWLKRYTFPAEARMKDANVAARTYDKLVRRLLANGTTTAVYFATIHLEATKRLVDIVRRRGQRAFVGKVCM